MVTRPKPDAVRIVKRLRERGHSAYLVGGCVRDMLMGEAPKDWDIATDAKPEEIMSMFEKTVPVGERFGVVLVRYRGVSYEVATFREEWGYEDSRRPDSVRFSNARADARRRDFTINGLFYDPVEERFLDYVGGKKDIRDGVVRAIGDPFERFEEDKLRLMRAIRFAARFDFRIEAKTAKALKELAPGIKKVSIERVRDELLYVLQGERPERGMRLLDEYGLLVEVLPEVADMKGVEQPPEFHPEGDVFEHTMLMLGMMKKKYKKRPGFVMAVLLHDVGKPPTFEVKDRIRFNNHTVVGERMTGDIMKRLRFPSKVVKTATELVRDHLRFIEIRNMRPAKLKRFLASEDFELHLELHYLDCKASHGDLSSYRFAKKKLNELKAEKKPIKPAPLITGKDLIAMGLDPGPRFKEILTAVEDAQLEGKVETRDEALALVESYIKSI